jgi:hypothetical protein
MPYAATTSMFSYMPPAIPSRAMKPVGADRRSIEHPTPDGGPRDMAELIGIKPNGDGVSELSGGDGASVRGTADGKAAAFTGDIEIGGNVSRSGQIRAAGHDCAEFFELADACGAEPGNVLVAQDDGRLVEGASAYDARVVGVVCGGGNYRPGILLGRGGKDGGRSAAIALVGRTECWVDAGYAPVEIGDLLTTSPTAGHAMKAVDLRRAGGCILGEALRPLRAGRGLVPILVVLR